jgi:hypothetical protein
MAAFHQPLNMILQFLELPSLPLPLIVQGTGRILSAGLG